MKSNVPHKLRYPRFVYWNGQEVPGTLWLDHDGWPTPEQINQHVLDNYPFCRKVTEVTWELVPTEHPDFWEISGPQIRYTFNVLISKKSGEYL